MSCEKKVPSVEELMDEISSLSLFLFGLCVHSVRAGERERETRMGIRTKGSRKGSRKGRTEKSEREKGRK